MCEWWILSASEALPGPQGTLFGSSAQSGTLRIVTQKPDTEAFAGQIDASVSRVQHGEFGYDVSGWLNVPLVEDKLAVRINAFSTKTGGWIDNVEGAGLNPASGLNNADVVEDNYNDWAQHGVRAHVLWKPSEDWSVLATGMYQKVDSSGSWTTDEAVGDYAIIRFRDDWYEDEWASVALTIKGDLGFAELVSATSYLDRKVDYEWDDTNYFEYITDYQGVTEYYSYYYYAYMPWSTGYDIGPAKGYTINDQKQSRFAQEVRLTSQGDSKLQWMAGAFYEEVTDQWIWGSMVPGLTDTPAWYYFNYYACGSYYGTDVSCPLEETDFWYGEDYDRTVKQIAIFGEASYALTEKLKVTAGARWFEYDRALTEHSFFPLGLPPKYSEDAYYFGGTDTSAGKNSDNVWRFGAQYTINDDVMTYFNFSQGFRLGGTNGRKAAAAGFVPSKYEADTLG